MDEDKNPDFAGFALAARIMHVIRFTGLTSSQFAAEMGWSKQYVKKLQDGESIGIRAVTTILRNLPDISARWLLLGDGLMLDITRHMGAFRSWVTLSDYIPVMTAEERERIDAGVAWTETDLCRWSLSLAELNTSVEERFMRVSDRENQG